MAKCGKGVELTLSWIPAEGGKLPPNAIDAGENTYVCRVLHNNEYIPGKLVQRLGSAYFPYGGREVKAQKYDVLCTTGSKKGFSWEQGYGGDVAKNTVVSGVAADGAPLYIARGKVQGETVVGKVHGGHDSAYFPYGGKEQSVAQYETLVLKKKDF